MRNIFLCIFIISLTPFGAAGQSTSDSVCQRVQTLFDAMRRSDAATVKDCFTATARLETVKAGGLETETIENFAQLFAKLSPGDADERIEFEAVHIDGDLATVWTPYQFYFRSKFSHCGVNALQLLRIEGKWKIHSIIDTRRKQPCQKQR